MELVFISSTVVTRKPRAARVRAHQTRYSRRDVLGWFLAGFALSAAPSSALAAGKWSPENLCKICSGKGTQTCNFCLGGGLYALGDSITTSTQVCPNCSGRGAIVCPACVGLGLRNVKGVLRDGARDGLLKVNRDGSIQILDCQAFPSCSGTG